MLINCPLKDKSEVTPLIKSGADIFYTGVNSEIIFHSPEGAANRRPWKFANFSSLSEFREAMVSINEHNKKVDLTLNEHFYTKNQINKILRFVAKYFLLLDGYIVTDISLIIQLKKNFPNIKLIASTGTHIQNRSSVEFYINLGISGIIIPRHFRISEIKQLIARYPSTEFECFIINDDCANIDGLCHYSHGIFDQSKINNPCSSLYNFKIISKDKEKDIRPTRQRLNRYNSIMFNICGICSIWDMAQIGIKRIKIVGRERPLKNKLKDVYFAKEAITNLGLPRNAFIKKVKENYKAIYKKECHNKCFYM